MPYEGAGKVLIVDDEEDHLKLLGIGLRSAGIGSEKTIKSNEYGRAVEILNNEPIKGLVVDGLGGWWQSLVELAIGVGVPPQAIVLCSLSASDRLYSSIARDLGIRSVSKQMPGFSREVAKIVSGW